MGSKVRIHYRPGSAKPFPEGSLDAVVRLDSGQVALNGGGGSPGPKEAELLAWLREALDEPTLAALRDRWARFKEARRVEEAAFRAQTWQDRDWTTWNGEDPVAWDEVVSLAEAGEDLYTFEGRTYEALDHYDRLADPRAAGVPAPAAAGAARGHTRTKRSLPVRQRPQVQEVPSGPHVVTPNDRAQRNQLSLPAHMRHAVEFPPRCVDSSGRSPRSGRALPPHRR